jgi:hypothetical protein
MMNHTDEWMRGLSGGGMWIWTVLAVLVVALWFVAMTKPSRK